jgi:polyhydroxybutyrate depolymerase
MNPSLSFHLLHLLPFVCTAACGSPTSPEQRPSGDAATPSALVQARPYKLAVPSAYDPTRSTPLVLLLHGYGIDGYVQAWYFGLVLHADLDAATAPPAGAERNGFLLAYPDGTLDSEGKRFWNGTDACCDFENSGVDDVAYLNAVIDDVEQQYNVDPKRIYVLGHSNGSFMAHRLACEGPERFAAIVALNGAQWSDPDRCTPAAPVNVLVAHGDADDVNLYDGGAVSPNGVSYPSPAQTVATWIEKNGCTGALVDGSRKDLSDALDGAETATADAAECPNGGAVSFWTIQGGAHIPNLGEAWSDEVWKYMAAHPKP